MHLASPWLVAQAMSWTRDRAGSRNGSEPAGRATQHVAAHDGSGPACLQGFAFTVPAAGCLAVEDAVGCSAQVVAGQAWITTEGAPQDIIAGAGKTVALQRGVRFNVSAYRDVATVLVTAPRYLHDVGFSLRRRGGVRVLSVRPGASRLAAWLSDVPSAIAAFARVRVALSRSATL